MKIINPATERVIKNISTDNSDSIREKYISALEAKQAFSRSSVADRLEITANFNDLLQKNQHKLADLLTTEMGKPIAQSRNEIAGAGSRISFFLEKSHRLLSDELVFEEGDMREFISYEPLGVIANISAWNYPYLVGVNVFVPAIIAGNAVLYKPSEYTSLTGLEIQKLWLQAGLDSRIFRTVLGTGKTGKLLLDLPLDGYFFTGSYATGKYIYEQVAVKMVPCQMELGGKDPLYVTEHNQNLKRTAQAAVEGAFYNNGHSCCAEQVQNFE
jgi:acyl-CoA reductase-like NAD-dependent aldehyde dehydrogenase